MAIATLTADPQVQASRRFLEALLADYGPRNFQVRFWDGSTWEAETQTPDFTLVLNHAGALRKMFFPPNGLTLGKAYIYDDCDIEGDMLAYVRFLSRLAATKRTAGQRLRLAWRLWNLPKIDRPRLGRQPVQLRGRAHSPERDRQAISYHYDLCNEFYARILDKHMQYTCGVYANENEDQDTAQTRKLDYHCKKLRLKPGERLLDIGCGWGGMVVFAAKNYGAHTTGVTLSKRQAEWAEQRIREAGLENQARIVYDDYRNLDERQSFDKIVTVCVLEHFGRQNFGTYFQKMARLLKPGGTLLIQQITLSGQQGLTMGRQFSQAYIFPDGELAPVSYTLSEGEKAGLEVRDVECLREHYPLSLRAWLDNVENRHDELVALTDEAAWRSYRFYFAGAMHGFQTNVYNLHHMLFVKPDNGRSGMPMSRADWYA